MVDPSVASLALSFALVVQRNIRRLVVGVLAWIVVLSLNGAFRAQGIPAAGGGATAAATVTQELNQDLGRQPIRGGWYPWDPYQYLEGSGERRDLTGLDVQLLREAFEGELGRELELSPVSWKQHQRDIRDGRRDVAGGAFRTAEREAYAYYSKPYRFEEVVVYRRRFEPIGTLALRNTSTLLQELQSGSSTIGLVRGYHYGDVVAGFAADPRHAARIVWADDHEANLRNLLNGKVQLAPVDRLVGATIAWRNKWTVDLVSSTFPVFRDSIHVLFSKRTSDPALVKRFDDAMARMRSDGRYNRIVQHYLFPVLLALTVGQDWFYMLEIIGTVAFALSGILIAQRDDFSLFGAFVLAALPAVGGGVIRDLIINRDVTAVLRSPMSLLVVIALVLLSALLIRVLPKVGRLPSSLRIEPLVDVLDAVALAAYTVVGVIVAIETRCEPLLLWGPLLSALTGAGGSVLRDVVRGDASHPTLRHALYAEIALVWGLALAAFLSVYARAETYDPLQLQAAIVLTMLGVLATRLLVIGKRIRAPRFR
ncbi:MAG: transporter substrate-binding domain-containing protein [Cyanobacteriota bacterium]|nr:transporter substrate-binding domain-containing protein [Cyanobacteriota bacterium]